VRQKTHMAKGNKRLRLAALGLILLGLWGMLALLLGASVGMESGYRVSLLHGSGETHGTPHPLGEAKPNGRSSHKDQPPICAGENCRGMEEVVDTALLDQPVDNGADDATSEIGPRRGPESSPPSPTPGGGDNAFSNFIPGTQFGGSSGGVGFGGSGSVGPGFGGPGFGGPGFGGPSNLISTQILGNPPPSFNSPLLDVPPGGPGGSPSPGSSADCVPPDKSSKTTQTDSSGKTSCSQKDTRLQTADSNSSNNSSNTPPLDFNQPPFSDSVGGPGGPGGSGGTFGAVINGAIAPGGLDVLVVLSGTDGSGGAGGSGGPGGTGGTGGAGGTGGTGGTGGPGGSNGPDAPIVSSALPTIELPEPLTLSLFAIGLAGALLLRRRVAHSSK
jgi:hypothetical protein